MICSKILTGKNTREYIEGNMVMETSNGKRHLDSSEVAYLCEENSGQDSQDPWASWSLKEALPCRKEGEQVGF